MQNNDHFNISSDPKVSVLSRLTTPFRLLYLFLQGVPVIGALLRPALFLLSSYALSFALATAAVGFDLCDPDDHQMVSIMLLCVSLPTVIVWGFKMTGRNTKGMKLQ